MADERASPAVALRDWREQDLPVLTALRNDVELQAKLLARARGSDEARVREWLHARCTGADRAFYVSAGPDGEPLGYLQFGAMDAVDRRAEVGICLAPSAQGRGAGTQALALGLDWLRARGMRKAHLQVRADNEAALRSYRKLGFVECGRLSRHFAFAGQWHDVLLMEAFLAPDA
jgi:RimJ/RimL family protein N-acetyltransferase